MKKFIVFGIGISGIATVKFLLKNKYQVIAADDNSSSLINLAEKFNDKNLIIADNLQKINWQDVSALVLSPGIALKYPEPHKAVVLAKKNNCPILGDVELLYLFNSKAQYIGITGTNGKSTTTALVGHIFKENNMKSFTGGNIGLPCLDLASQDPDISYILEMSSYQLDLISKTRFNIATLLNITEDHLDRHLNMKGYIAAKKRIFLNQKQGDFAVINIDDNNCRQIYQQLKSDPEFKASLIAISTNNITENGISVIDNMLYNNIGSKSTAKLPDLPALRGEHNAQNIAAAFANCFLTKISQNNIIESLKNFHGLKHRLQLVATINNINFINDSKGTNANSTKYALKAYDNIYWILGGKSKEGGIKSLKNYFSKIKYAFLIGQSQEEFAKILADNKVKYYKCDNLENAFKQAYQIAKADEKDNLTKNILLSPACASFDQWPNFEVRGDYFCKLVNKLK